jgi:transcriptional regulator with XRE-family HTH domain
MVSLITASKAQEQLANHIKARRLDMGLTQEGLAKRSGVSISTLRKFEHTGIISLASFLKLLMVLGGIEEVVQAVEPSQEEFKSIDDVLANDKPKNKRGWRK